jgi:hypothetical protein
MLDQDVVPAGYQLVRKTVDKLVAGDVVSMAAKKFPYFYTVTQVHHWEDRNKGPVVHFVYKREFPNGTYTDVSFWKSGSRIWVLDKMDDAG